jgi:bifunctional DNA-binding transcriptional regulator/antitoxin component of YhaV-PrlF toxin-antitoxin module
MAIRELETFEIELREGGNLTVTKSLRDALRLEPGEMLRAIKVGNAIVLTPQRMDLDALRQQMRGLMKEHGVTAEDVLRDL